MQQRRSNCFLLSSFLSLHFYFLCCLFDYTTTIHQIYLISNLIFLYQKRERGCLFLSAIEFRGCDELSFCRQNEDVFLGVDGESSVYFYVLADSPDCGVQYACNYFAIFKTHFVFFVFIYF